MKLNSIRFKASVLYTSILCVILVVFSGVLFSVTRHILYRDVDDRLQMKATEIINILKSYEKLKQTETQQQHLINKLLGLEDRARLIVDDLWRSNVRALNLADDYINILNTHGQPIIRSQNFDQQIDDLFRQNMPLTLNYVVFKDIINKSARLRVVNLPFSYSNRHLLIIQIATPLDSVIHVLARLLYFIIGSILFILALTSFLGGFFARRILKPVSHVTRIADDISHTDLNRRIPEIGADDEMQGLIRSLNAMIGRLETAFAHINQFSSHVAHELKTPLAIVKGEMELALRETRSPDEYQRVLAVSLEEVDRLVRIIRDLLLLARLDYSPDVFSFETFDLSAFLADIHEHSNILAEPKHLAIHLDVPAAPLWIRGDEAHLRRLFLNLIHNAVKFTPEKGQIIITLGTIAGHAQVTVSDTGKGIASQNIANVFNPFFHTRPDDPDAEPGSGLGLSIAQAIAKAHKGEITVQSPPGEGAAFTVRLPLA
ncbi:MAG: ATP-binding protein [Desulfosalsimonadaceae bacterium]|nr:ATP-binding protein [Desulfosalsimonadaceae bacterium]